jgi:drug/metabolite transporter (DMT)-like permease
VTRRGWALFLALGVIWGLPYLLIRVSMREVSPVFLVFVRTAGGALLLAPFVVRRGALAPLLSRWKAVCAYTVVEIVVPWVVLSNAEKTVTSSLSGLLVAAVPIAGAVMARLTGTDRIDRRRATGLVLGLAGVAALVGFDVGGPHLLVVSSFLLIIGGYALGPWIFSKYLADLRGPSVVIASLTLAAIVYAPFAVVQRPHHELSTSVLLSLLGLIVVCTVGGFLAFFALISEIGPMRAIVITYLNPAVAVLLGVVVLGEPFGPATAVGFVLVLSGSVLATRPLRSKAVPGTAPETETETAPVNETARATETEAPAPGAALGRPFTVAEPTVAEP